MTGDLTFIASDRSWADRFSQLLKELQAVNAPDLCANSSQIAAKTCLPPISIAEKPEVRTSNFLPFDRMPEGLHCFSQTRRLTDKENADLLRHWVLWRVDPKTVLSFSAPPAGSWSDAFKEQDAWAVFERVKRAPATNIVSSFLHKSVKMGSLRPGHGETADHKSIFIPSGLTQTDKITFEHNGCKTWLKVRGHPTLSRIDKLLQRCYHHLAINHRIRQNLINRFGLEMADSIFDLFHKQKPEPGMRPAQTLIKATPARKGDSNLAAPLIKPH
jgi:hypothetical protein